MNVPFRKPDEGEQVDIDEPAEGEEEIDVGHRQMTPAQEAQDEYDEPGESAEANDPQRSRSGNRTQIAEE